METNAIVNSRLTPKQRKFCDCVISGMGQSEAYRAAYNTEKMKPETVNRSAFELMENPKIAATIKEGQKAATERAVWSRQMAQERLQVVNDAAYSAISKKGVKVRDVNHAFFNSTDRLNDLCGIGIKNLDKPMVVIIDDIGGIYEQEND